MGIEFEGIKPTTIGNSTEIKDSKATGQQKIGTFGFGFSSGSKATFEKGNTQLYNVLLNSYDFNAGKLLKSHNPKEQLCIADGDYLPDREYTEEPCEA